MKRDISPLSINNILIQIYACNRKLAAPFKLGLRVAETLLPLTGFGPHHEVFPVRTQID